MNSRNRRLDVFEGMIWLVICHAIAGGLGYAISMLGLQLGSEIPMALMLRAGVVIGLTQMIYVVPLCLRLRRRRQLDKLKGVVIGAVITILLNGSCFLFVLSLINQMYG